MAERTRSVELAIDNTKALKALDQLRVAEVKIAKAVADGNRTQESGTKSLDKIAKKRKDLIKVNRVLDDSFGKTTKAIKEEDAALSDLDKQLKALDETSSKRRQQIGLAGDVGSAGRTLGGAAGAFGGEAGEKIEKVISALSELPDSLEAIGQLGPALKGLPSVVTKVSDSVGLGGLAGKIQSLRPAMGSAAASTIALTLPLAAVAITIGGLALIFGKLAEQSERTREATRSQFDAQTEVNDLLREGAGSTEILEARADAERDMIKLSEDLTRAEEEMMANRLNLNISFSESKAIEQEYLAVIDELKPQLSDATLRLGEFNEHVFDAEFAANDAAAAEAELVAQRAEEVVAINQQIVATENSASAALQAADQLGQQVADADASRNKSQADAAELSALDAEIEGRKREESAQKHQLKLTQIASEGESRLQELQSGFGDLAADRLSALGGVEAKGNEELSSLRDDFFDSQIEDTQDFQRETAKIETDTAKKRTKLLEDLNDSLSDAARDNNVIAFLEAQRDGNKALAEDAISATDAEKQRVDEFARQRDAERAIFQEKNAEILIGIETEKQAVIKAFAEKQIALADQIAAEKVAIEERIELETQSENKRLAQQAQSDEDASRRAALRKAQADRDFQDEQNRLRALQGQKLQLYQDEQTAIAALVQSVAQLQQAASAPPPTRETSRGGSSRGRSSRGRSSGNQTGQSTSSLTSGSLPPSRFGQRRPNQAFHDGGEIKFPSGQTEGFAFVEQGEQIVSNRDLATKGGNGLPFPTQGKSGSGNGQSVSVTVQDNRQINIGDIATVAAVESALARSNEAIVTSIHKTFESATA